jgi:hypothetical protein
MEHLYVPRYVIPVARKIHDVTHTTGFRINRCEREQIVRSHKYVFYPGRSCYITDKADMRGPRGATGGIQDLVGVIKDDGTRLMVPQLCDELLVCPDRSVVTERSCTRFLLLLIVTVLLTARSAVGIDSSCQCLQHQM